MNPTLDTAKFAKDYGTPFYLFDETGFLANIHDLSACFRSFWPEYTPAYSFKTNYTPYICRLAKAAGCYAEVVSDMEYTLAKKLGYTDGDIIYNGPFKGELLDEHFLAGGICNIDSYEETLRICRLANSAPERNFRCGIRINLDLGAGFISRFGMAEDSTDLQKSLDAIRKCPNLKLSGLHCHIKAPRDPESWKRRAEIMISAADRYIDGVPEFISLGSGMVPGRYDQGPEAPECFKPSYKDFAEALFQPFLSRYGKGPRPRIFTEPGRALITRYVSLVSKVDNIKEVRGRHIATLDACFYNLGEMSSMTRVPLNIRHCSQGEYYESIDLMGYTCLEQDVLLPSYAGRLAVGDLVEFGNAGAYSIVYKPPFMTPQCAMYAICRDGSIKTIMREESFDDIFAKFCE